MIAVFLYRGITSIFSRFYFLLSAHYTFSFVLREWKLSSVLCIILICMVCWIQVKRWNQSLTIRSTWIPNVLCVALFSPLWITFLICVCERASARVFVCFVVYFKSTLHMLKCYRQKWCQRFFGELNSLCLKLGQIVHDVGWIEFSIIIYLGNSFVH